MISDCRIDSICGIEMLFQSPKAGLLRKAMRRAGCCALGGLPFFSMIVSQSFPLQHGADAFPICNAVVVKDLSNMPERCLGKNELKASEANANPSWILPKPHKESKSKLAFHSFPCGR